MEERNKKQQISENLQFIKEMMESSQKIVHEKGNEFLVWGILVVLGQIGNFVMVEIQSTRYISWMWIMILTIGWIYTMVIKRKEGRLPACTFSDKVLRAVWQATLISMSMVGLTFMLLGILQKPMLMSGLAINPMISFILAVAYYVTGVIVGLNIYKKLAWGWWIGAIILFFVVNHYSFLIFGLMMIFLQIIPGFWYKRHIETEV